MFFFFPPSLSQCVLFSPWLLTSSPFWRNLGHWALVWGTSSITLLCTWKLIISTFYYNDWLLPNLRWSFIMSFDWQFWTWILLLQRSKRKEKLKLDNQVWITIKAKSMISFALLLFQIYINLGKELFFEEWTTITSHTLISLYVHLDVKPNLMYFKTQESKHGKWIGT